ncbi:MAG: hypothetical protein AB8B73_11690 [Ekhidna sp.]
MKRLLYITLFASFISGCTDETISPSNLDGEWVLTSYVCFCLPESREINIGDHIWSFDAENRNLIVENTSDKESNGVLLSSGTYPISVSDSSITISESSYDFSFEDDYLILSDQPELDGPILTFIKKSEFEAKVDTCEAKAIVSESIYNNGPAAFHTIESVELTNNCLHITYASSGCSGDSWEATIVDQGIVLESFPVQRSIRLSLTNEEACQAVFKKDIWVDISPLQAKGEPKINFNLDGWDEQILYEY